MTPWKKIKKLKSENMQKSKKEHFFITLDYTIS